MVNKFIRAWAAKKMAARKPDVVIGGPDNPYLLRWHILPRNRFFNIYLHRILRSDDDRALHDHPWFNLSYLVKGGYHEHTIAAGGINNQTWRETSDFKVRSPWAAHRLVIEPGIECITLFVTGPRVRTWGFHCPEKGWVPWTIFTSPLDKGQVGRGCE